ncbi:MAG: hypothetical protein WAM82_25205 [Thermoanaerobaculia bacterium]
MEFLVKLRKEDPSSAVAYHLEGLLESNENIKSWLIKLGEADPDLESTSETLAYLQVEIYTHLTYRMKGLRRPFKRLLASAYKSIPDIAREDAESKAGKKDDKRDEGSRKGSRGAS